MKDIASLNSVKEFYKLNIDSINFFNEQFLSETSKKDKVYYKGIGLYIFDKNYLFNKSKYIKSRISEIEQKLVINHNQEEDNFERKNLLDKEEIKNLK